MNTFYWTTYSTLAGYISFHLQVFHETQRIIHSQENVCNFRLYKS